MGRVGNYVFRRIGHHVGSLTWVSLFTRRRVDPAVPEQLQARIDELTQERDQARRELDQARQNLELARCVQPRAVGPDNPSRCSVCLKQRNAVRVRNGVGSTRDLRPHCRRPDIPHAERRPGELIAATPEETNLEREFAAPMISEPNRHSPRSEHRMSRRRCHVHEPAPSPPIFCLQ
jgi:hypothetical protein